MLRPVPDPSPDAERSDCPLDICEGNGWVLQEDNTAIPCKCRERRIGKAFTRGMGTGIPERFWGVWFDRKPICDLDQGIVGEVRRFTDGLEANLEAGHGMWFYGEVGTGKTSLAMLVARRALEAGHSVAIYSVPRLLYELRASYDADSRESFLSLFKRLCSVDLLVLDDLGAERQTEWVVEQLYSIVNERWQNRASIVVTSNVPQPDRQGPVEQLQYEIDELRDSRTGGRELTSAIDRLEQITATLARLDNNPHLDPFQTIRDQVGDRTVSRLFEICDDPLPIMGPDLRKAFRGASV